MAKNQQNGIAQNLESEATKNSQPNKLFIPGSKSIPGSDPEQPSINNATRREQYNVDQMIERTKDNYSLAEGERYLSHPNEPYPRGNSELPYKPSEDYNLYPPESTKIGGYDTVAATMPKDYYPKEQTTIQDYLGAIKKLPGFSYSTEDFERQMAEVEKSLQEQGVDTTKQVYGNLMTEAAKQRVALNMQYGQLLSQENQITNTQASNAKLILTLATEVRAGLAQGQSIKDIAKNLGQEERVIQKIANNQTEELIQLNAEYEEEQMRGYLRNREDLDIDIARNIAQYNNLVKNLDYQFNSSMTTLERSLFDAEWAAKTNSAIYGMTGTEYTLNRIKAQYQQQMDDLKNTYNYQSANAQMAINYALEDYNKNLVRRAEDYATARKGIQAYALQTIMNIQNNIGLTGNQMVEALNNAYASVQKAQSGAITDYLAAIEAGNTTLATQIANAYGLTTMTTKQFTSQELGRTSTSTIGNDTNNLGHILASDDGTRIGTYKSPNGYTYNVYATREDGLIATKALLEKAYYGMTLKAAAQKWIGQGKDISAALGVMENLGLDINSKLSDENVRKFMEAIGRREGTIKQGETLDDRVKGGKDLSSYAQQDAIVSDDELKAAKNIYEADMEMLKDVQAFKDAYSNLEDVLNMNIGDINVRGPLQTAAKRELELAGASTVRDLFQMATDSYSPNNEKASLVLSALNNEDLDNAVLLFGNIVNKTFIERLVTAKGQGATFGNLTEGEGRKIQDAYNKISGKMNYKAMMGGINNLISNLTNDLTYMNNLYGTNLKVREKFGETNVTPQPKTEDEAISEVENMYGPGVVITPL